VTPGWPDDPITVEGHPLTIDAGWQDVAQTCLDFIARFVK
jgi:hypothetical protein